MPDLEALEIFPPASAVPAENLDIAAERFLTLGGEEGVRAADLQVQDHRDFEAPKKLIGWPNLFIKAFSAIKP